MNNLILLLKIQIQTLLSRVSATNSKKKVASIGLIMIPMLACLYMSFMYSFLLLDTLPEGSKHITLYVIGLMAVFMLVTFGYQSAAGHLFGFKDYDLLKSLPFTNKQILASKFISFSMLEYMYDLFLLLPAFLICGIKLRMGISYYLIGICLIVVLPVVPLIIAAVLAYLTMFLSGKSRFNTIFKNLFSILFVALIFLFSFSFQSLMNMNVTALQDLANNISRYLPFMGWIMDAMFGDNIFKAVIGIGFNILLLIAFIILFSQNFIRLNGQIKKGYRVKNFQLKAEKEQTVLLALIKKEIRTYFSNSTYVMNTIVFPIMLVGGAIYLLWNKSMLITLPDSVVSMIPILLSVAIMFGTLTCCSTNCSISIEGKQFYLLKSLPLNVSDIFKAKIILNLLILVPTCTFAIIIASIALNIGIEITLLLWVEMIACSLFISLFGLILNLHFYRLDYENAVYVVKQSLPVFVTVFSGMIISMLVLFVSLAVEVNSFTLVSTLAAVFGIIDVMQVIYLKYRGEYLFSRIY